MWCFVSLQRLGLTLLVLLSLLTIIVSGFLGEFNETPKLRVNYLSHKSGETILFQRKNNSICINQIPMSQSYCKETQVNKKTAAKSTQKF